MSWSVALFPSTFSSLTRRLRLRILKLPMKMWTDALFLFAVVAGLVYEFLYEPVRDLVAWCVKAAITATTGTWRRIAGEHAAGVS